MENVVLVLVGCEVNLFHNHSIPLGLRSTLIAKSLLNNEHRVNAHVCLGYISEDNLATTHVALPVSSLERLNDQHLPYEIIIIRRL